MTCQWPGRGPERPSEAEGTGNSSWSSRFSSQYYECLQLSRRSPTQHQALSLTARPLALPGCHDAIFLCPPFESTQRQSPACAGPDRACWPLNLRVTVPTTPSCKLPTASTSVRRRPGPGRQGPDRLDPGSGPGGRSRSSYARGSLGSPLEWLRCQ